LRHVQLPLTSGGGFAGVDMADDDDVDMSLFFTVVRVGVLAIVIDIKSKPESSVCGLIAGG
jgi:hypothetical protein